MSLDTKLRKKVDPILEPGEAIDFVFIAQTGPSPYWLFLSYLMFYRMANWVFVVTSHRILVYRGSIWIPSSVKGEPTELPRETSLELVPGLWGTLTIEGKRYWVHKSFQKAVNAANATRPGQP